MACESRTKRAFDEYNIRLGDNNFLRVVGKFYDENPNIAVSGTLDQYKDYLARVSSGILPNSTRVYSNDNRNYSVLEDNEGGFNEYINNHRDVNDIRNIVGDLANSQSVNIGRDIFTDIMELLSKSIGKEYKVISSDEARNLIGDKYKGESGFYFNNTAYILDFATDLNVGIHEISHPFVDAIAEKNKDLFDKLISDILSTNIGKSIMDQVKKDYNDSDELHQNKELLTRFLSNQIQLNIQNNEKEKVKNIWNRIIFALKQLFRKIFGSKISLSKLNPNMTLKELADMLSSGEHKFDTSTFSEKDIIQYLKDNKELIQDITVIKHDELVKIVDRIQTKAGQHNKLSGGFKEIKDTITAEGSRNNFQNIIHTSDLVNDENNTLEKSRQLANIIGFAQDMAESIRNRIIEINDDTSEPNKDTINRLFYFQAILSDWKYLSEELGDLASKSGIKSGSAMNKALSDLDYNIAIAIKESTRKELDAMVNTLGGFFEGVANNIKKDHEAQMKVWKDAAKKNPKLQKIVDRKEKAFERLDLSKENLAKYMKGEHGDANFWAGLVMAYISQPDPVVSTFATFVEYHVLGTNAEFRRFDNSLRNELEPLFNKARINRTDPSELAKLVLFSDEIMEYDEEGKPKKGNVYALLQKFKNFRYQRDLLEYELNVAIASGDKDKIAEASKNRNQFHSDYMHRKYKSEYYKLQDIWKTPEGQLAYKARKEIFDDINFRQSQLSKDPEQRDEELKVIDELFSQLSRLGSLSNFDGTPKVDRPEIGDYSRTIALTIKKYNELSRDFYEDTPIENLFETKLNEYVQYLTDKNSLDGQMTPEQIQEERKKWIDRNTRKIPKQSFYEDRQERIDTITKILSKLPDAEKKKLSLDPLYKLMIDQTIGFRDQDGQIIGTDLSAEKIAEIKQLQEEINKVQDNFIKITGLTGEEQDELNNLYKTKKENGKWTDEEYERLVELKERKNEIKDYITDNEFIQLNEAFAFLRELQSKVPTDYYMNTIDEWFGRMNIPLVDKFDINDFINSTEFNNILNSNPEFEKWFENNHIIKEKWVPAKEGEQYGSYEDQWERLYNWSYIIPNDPSYLESFELSTGETISGKPNRSYFFRAVKKKFHTGYNPNTGKVELKVGVHISNKHTNERPDFLPKTIADGAKDDTYINQDYEKLKTDNPEIFQILQIFTNSLLKVQEGLSMYSRLYLDYPRFGKKTDEYVLGGQLAKDVGSKLVQVKKATGALIGTRSDDYQRGLGNYEDELKERLGNFDMFGNDIARIPQQGLANIPPERLSLNVGESIMRYAHSALMNQTLSDLQPMAKALIRILEQQGVKDIKTISKWEYIKNGIRVFGKPKGNKNRRADILRNMYETIWEGKTSHMELGKHVHKIISELSSLTAYASLSVNIPGAIKNMISGNIQSFIESFAGEFLNTKDYSFGQIRIAKSIPNILADYNKLADHSFDTQILRAFDFIKGETEDKIGREFANMNARYVTNLGTSFMGMKTGEIQLQGAFFWAMMHHQMVPQTINGVTKDIHYDEAFELVDGNLTLKEGIPEEWGEGGDQFRRFQLKLHELSRRLQGNYASSTQPEAMRYTTLSLALLMRRYFPPMFMNRFQFDAVSPSLGRVRPGYYTVFGQMIKDTAKTHSLNWSLYSDAEQKAAIRTMGEIAIAVLFYIALRILGWDSSDPDKFKKLKENSWVYNHLLYQVMLVKSETEQFIPLPGLGGDEVLRLLKTPSIAINYFAKWYKLSNDIIDIAGYEVGLIDQSQLRTQQKSGIWDKDTLKLYRDAMRVFGRTGATEDPLVGIRNWHSLQANPTR